MAGQQASSWPIVRHHEKRYGCNLWIFCSDSYSDKKAYTDDRDFADYICIGVLQNFWEEVLLISY